MGGDCRMTWIGWLDGRRLQDDLDRLVRWEETAG